MEIINDENLTKLIEAMVCVCQEDEDVTIRQNALQCIYELTNKILDTALLSELAYLKLENEYFKDKNYSLDNINKFF